MMEGDELCTVQSRQDSSPVTGRKNAINQISMILSVSMLIAWPFRKYNWRACHGAAKIIEATVDRVLLSDKKRTWI